MDRPSPFFPKRNSTRIVLKARNKVTRSSPRPTFPSTTVTTTTTVQAKATRKSVRRKITRNPNATKKAPETTLKNYEEFSSEIDEKVASVLPAITSVRPRQSSLRVPTTRQLNIETSTLTLQNFQPNEIEDFHQIQQKNPSSFDEILKQQYKIKGIDVTSGENFSEDERLIGVLGSQVIGKFMTLFINF